MPDEVNVGVSDAVCDAEMERVFESEPVPLVVDVCEPVCEIVELGLCVLLWDPVGVAVCVCTGDGVVVPEKLAL